ncbi:MAG: energy transducer TonB [Vicinamibacterales bacterium]
MAATPAVVLERTPARRPEALAVGDSLEPVDVEVTVAPDGHAIKAVALSATEVVQRAAEAAALSWRYRPATAGGSPSQSELRVRVPFDQPPER